MVYDTDFRECVVADDDVAAALIEKGADTMNAFVVPTTASKITKISIGLGSVSAAQDAVLAATSGVHLFGGGISLAEGWFAGPTHTESGAAATSAGYDWDAPMIYKTNIPVKPGGLFNADAFLHGEDLADAHMLLGIEYDGFPGRVVDADYREVDIGAAANTNYALVARGAAAAEGDFRPAYSQIIEIACGGAPDVAGGDVGFNVMQEFTMSGAGLVNAGNYNFAGYVGWLYGDTDISGPGATKNLVRHTFPSIPVKRGNSIRVHGQNIESIQATHSIFCICYG